MNENKKESPSMDQWLKEAKAHPKAQESGMYLVHNGVVRKTPRDKVRYGIDDGSDVRGMEFSFDGVKVAKLIDETYNMDGIFYVKVWLNKGELSLGDDIMYAMVGGDIRPNVINALEFLIGKIKKECVREIEHKK